VFQVRLLSPAIDCIANKDATTINAAIRPYSIAVAPEHSACNRLNKIVITYGIPMAMRPECCHFADQA
jgi:hypothetical protein